MLGVGGKVDGLESERAFWRGRFFWKWTILEYIERSFDEKWTLFWGKVDDFSR